MSVMRDVGNFVNLLDRINRIYWISCLHFQFPPARHQLRPQARRAGTKLKIPNRFARRKVG